jgi:hypothetical protein
MQRLDPKVRRLLGAQGPIELKTERLRAKDAAEGETFDLKSR